PLASAATPSPANSGAPRSCPTTPITQCAKSPTCDGCLPIRRSPMKFPSQSNPQSCGIGGSSVARPFSYPEVTKLEVGESVHVDAHHSEVARKVGGYAKRNGKAFDVTYSTAGGSVVVRLPDPVAEQSEAAR